MIISSSTPEVADEFVHYFTSLFILEIPAEPIDLSVINYEHIITDEEKTHLSHLVFNFKIMSVLFAISKDKALGRDKYSSYFFKNSWGKMFM